MSRLRTPALMMGVRGSIVVLGFVNSVVTARFLMPSGRGQYAIIMAAVGLYAFLAGSPGTAVALVAAQRGRSQLMKSVMAGLLWALLAGTLAVLAAQLWPSAGTWRVALLVAALGLPSNLIVSLGEYVCLGRGRLRLLATTQVAQPVINTVGCFILIGSLHRGLVGATAAWSLSWAIVSMASIWILSTVPRPSMSFSAIAKDVFQLLRFGIGSAVPGCMTFLTNRALLVIVQAMLGISPVGVYSLSMSISQPIATIATGTAMTAYPQLADSASRPTRMRQFLQLTVITSAVLALSAFVLAWWLLVPIFGQPYAAAVQPLPVLLLAYVVASGREVLSYYYMHEAANVRLPAVSATLGFLAAAAVAMPLTAAFHLVGAALSTLVGTTVTVVGMLAGMRKYGIRPLEVFHIQRAELAELGSSLPFAGLWHLPGWAKH